MFPVRFYVSTTGSEIKEGVLGRGHGVAPPQDSKLNIRYIWAEKRLGMIVDFLIRASLLFTQIFFNKLYWNQSLSETEDSEENSKEILDSEYAGKAKKKRTSRKDWMEKRPLNLEGEIYCMTCLSSSSHTTS